MVQPTCPILFKEIFDAIGHRLLHVCYTSEVFQVLIYPTLPYITRKLVPLKNKQTNLIIIINKAQMRVYDLFYSSTEVKRYGALG